MRRRNGYIGFAWAVGISLLVVCVWVVKDHTAPTAWLSHGIFDMDFYFLGWRIGILSVLMSGWPAIVSYLAKRHQWNEDHRLWVMECRWRILAWLLIIEFLLVQGILPRVMQGMMA